MQSWQQVQVINSESEHATRAGYVLRVEGPADRQLITVKLDEVSTPVQFDASELRVL